MKTTKPPSLASEKNEGGTVKVETDFDECLITLSPTSKENEPVRVLLKSEEDSKKQIIKPGRYNIRNIMISRKHKSPNSTREILWTLSCTSNPGVEVEIKKGEETKIAGWEGVKIKLSAEIKGEAVEMLCVFTDNKNVGGATVSKGGQKVDVTYYIKSKDNKILASGKMKYG